MPLVLSVSTTESFPIFFTRSSLRYLYIYWWDSFSRLNSTSPDSLVYQMLESLRHLDGISLNQPHHIHISLVLGSPTLDPASQTCLTSAEQRRRITSPSLLAMFYLMHPWRMLAFSAAKAHCWLLVHQEHQVLFFQAALQAVNPRPVLLQTIDLGQFLNLFGNRGIISVLHPWHVYYGTVPLMNLSASPLRNGQVVQQRRDVN